MKKIIIPIIASAMFAACTSENFEQLIQGDKFDGQVSLTSQPYTFEDGTTRTALTNTGSSIEFAWKNGEVIGIFPIAPTTNNQAKQVLSVSGSATNATFDGAGWALLRGNTYAAYTPYQPNLDEVGYTAVPIDMTGQTQNGNNNLVHIGNGYDYMYANASVPSNGNVNFAFNHVGSIIMLELTMPENAQWTKATLTAESDVFVTSATMNVSDGTLANKQMSNSISLDLDNVTGRLLTLYMSALPCTTGSVTLKVKKSNNEELSATLASKTLVAGHAYKWKFSWAQAPSNAQAVDLGLSVKWANLNIGATSPEQYGTYFAWGEVDGAKMASDESIIAPLMDGNSNSWPGGVNPQFIRGQVKSYTGLWENYKWDDGINIYKYSTSSKTNLDPEDDAAVVNWESNWRMPTLVEQKELFENCYWVYTSNYNNTGSAGYIVYKVKNEGDKGKKILDGMSPSNEYNISDIHIFLVMAGTLGSSFGNRNTNFAYWSSTLYNDKNAYMLCAYSDQVLEEPYSSRWSSKNIRAVCP